jgi:hypothetical protein
MTMLQQQPHPHDDDAVLTVLLAHAAEPVASGFGRTDSSTARSTMTTMVGDRSKSAGARRGSTARSWWTHKTQGNTENQQRERSSSSLLSSRHNKNDRSYRVRMSPLVVLLLTTGPDGGGPDDGGFISTIDLMGERSRFVPVAAATPSPSLRPAGPRRLSKCITGTTIVRALLQGALRPRRSVPLASRGRMPTGRLNNKRRWKKCG